MASGDFEQIVRPFQTPNIRPVKDIKIYTPPVPDDSDTVVWGSSGSNVFQLNAHVKQDVKPAEWPEIERTFDVVRVKDPNNSDNHIDIEVMTQFKARNKSDNTRFQMDLSRTEPSENVEIISRDNVRTSGNT